MAFFVFNGFGWGEGSFNYRVPFIRAYINLIGADGTAFSSDKVSIRAFDNPFGADRIQILAYRDPFRADKIPIGAYSSFFRAEENDSPPLCEYKPILFPLWIQIHIQFTLETVVKYG